MSTTPIQSSKKDRQMYSSALQTSDATPSTIRLMFDVDMGKTIPLSQSLRDLPSSPQTSPIRRSTPSLQQEMTPRSMNEEESMDNSLEFLKEFGQLKDQIDSQLYSQPDFESNEHDGTYYVLLGFLIAFVALVSAQFFFNLFDYFLFGYNRASLLS
jgi:hypothetical protein